MSKVVRRAEPVKPPSDLSSWPCALFWWRNFCRLIMSIRSVQNHFLVLVNISMPFILRRSTLRCLRMSTGRVPQLEKGGVRAFYTILSASWGRDYVPLFRDFLLIWFNERYCTIMKITANFLLFSPMEQIKFSSLNYGWAGVEAHWRLTTSLAGAGEALAHCTNFYEYKDIIEVRVQEPGMK